ncbi:MAG: hypothetical protein JOY64_27985 [Alphaproteobacteria bacterium]|nr:hypothetical protein [Alphaproteobacteria bacterium]MBV8411500.1 hypothetical protein [Alphaproteobacteria bacterium]
MVFDRWFGSFTEVIAAVGTAAVLIYLGYAINRRRKKLQDLFYVLGPDSTLMAEHLEELVQRGVIRPYREPAAV